MQFPITIGLHRSRFLDAGILLAALLATSAILYWPQPTAVQAGTIVVLWGISAVALLGASPSLRMIRLERDGRILAAGVDQDAFFPVHLLPGATIHHWLSVVRLKNGTGQVFVLIATVDSLSGEDFRRLRLFLRWQANFSGESGDA